MRAHISTSFAQIPGRIIVRVSRCRKIYIIYEFFYTLPIEAEHVAIIPEVDGSFTNACIFPVLPDRSKEVSSYIKNQRKIK